MCDNNIYSAGHHIKVGQQVDPERATGRTSRSIEQALCGMLRGQQVLLVMGNMDQVRYALIHATEWLYRNGWTGQKDIPLSVEKSNHLIRFGTGLLRILPLEANLRGLRSSLIVEDHYAVQVKAERAAAAEKMADAQLIKELMRKHGWSAVDDMCHIGKREKLVLRT